MHPQPHNPLSSLPNSSVRDVKDGWRNIAQQLWYSQERRQLRDKTWEPGIDQIWVTLRKLLGSTEAQKHVDKESLKEILAAIEKHRNRIIELISDKECVRVIVGADKHVKQKRLELAKEVLTELEWKIQDALK